MKDSLIGLFTKFNAFLIHITRGKLGGKLGSQAILVLHTRGRKSGKIRTTPIAYYKLEGRYLVLASNWGRERQADWYLNLREHPEASIEVEGQTLPVRASSAEGEEYNRLWEYVTERFPQYKRYQEMTSRKIPIVLLAPR